MHPSDLIQLLGARRRHAAEKLPKIEPRSGRPTRWGERVLVSGSTPELGLWDPDNAVGAEPMDEWGDAPRSDGQLYAVCASKEAWLCPP